MQTESRTDRTSHPHSVGGGHGGVGGAGGGRGAGGCAAQQRRKLARRRLQAGARGEARAQRASKQVGGVLHRGECARLPEEVGEAGAEGGLVAHRHEHATSGRTEESDLADVVREGRQAEEGRLLRRHAVVLVPAREQEEVRLAVRPLQRAAIQPTCPRHLRLAVALLQPERGGEAAQGGGVGRVGAAVPGHDQPPPHDPLAAQRRQHAQHAAHALPRDEVGDDEKHHQPARLRAAVPPRRAGLHGPRGERRRDGLEAMRRTDDRDEVGGEGRVLREQRVPRDAARRGDAVAAEEDGRLLRAAERARLVGGVNLERERVVLHRHQRQPSQPASLHLRLLNGGRQLQHSEAVQHDHGAGGQRR
mmetsp:Transcript_11757/g.38699  ORF Transcript_11757/g.38699 Transcript_11757/m.38699 type:complete len:362 (-) Transcript_11757:398-1483(-)